MYIIGFWAVEVEAMSAEEGTKKLEIKCSHSNAQGNTKYFCKDPCNNEDVLITSKQTGNKKYSISDTGNIFYVTISDLTLEDAGVYWCGVDRVGLDTYNYVSITVTPRTQEDLQSNAALQSKAFNKKLVYIGVGLGALLLILLTAVAVFIKNRHGDISKPLEDDEVTYSDPFKYKQKPSQDTTSCSSANQSSAVECSRSITHDPTCDIYTNVENDGVCYSSVLLSKTRVDTTPSERRTTHESTVYSEVKT